jgi:hypothetical protein
VNGFKLGATAPTGGRVQVHLVSAERLLTGLPDRSVDLVLTDPPYVSVNRSSSTSSHLRDWFSDGLTWPQIGHVFAIARRKLKADGVLMAMTNNDGLREAIGALDRAGFIGIRTITWDRKYPGLGGGLRHQTEFVLVGRLPGSRTLAGVDLVSVAAVGPGTADRYPTAKPDGLGRELAAMAGIGRGSLVVDPFAGSGALLVGAAERGATVIAGDVSKRAVQQASAQLARAGSGTRRSTTAARPVGPGKPTGSSRSTPGSSRSTTGTSRSTPGASRSTPGASRSTTGKPTGTRRSNPVARPANTGKPTGSSRTTPGTRPATTGKPTGSSRSTPGASRSTPGASRSTPGASRSTPGASRSTTPARSTGASRPDPGSRPTNTGKPTGTRRSTPATRPANTGKPTGTRRSTPVARPANPGKPTGSGRSTPGARPTNTGKPTGSGRTTPAARPTNTGKPTGSGRTTPAASRSTPVTRPANPGKPTGSGRSTPGASKSMRQVRPGVRR